MNKLIYISLFLVFSFFHLPLDAQTINGEILDISNNEALIGATILLKDTDKGTTTDFDGSFQMDVPNLPVTVTVSYIGYEPKDFVIETEEKQVLKLGEDPVNLVEVEVISRGPDEKAKSAPLTVESLDIKAIKDTPSENFYDGLGALKGVDLTASSLGFKVINTRGFNSTSPVRSLQIIDGVDNQAPGLNFSLGNFLGASELDVVKVDIVVGASSAFFGPNAFNGVVSMETKNPFYHKGLSASVKVGERNLLNAALRYGDSFKNKEGDDFLAYKVNLFHLRADDWEANNFDPVYETNTEIGAPGRWDGVNIYGDEFQRRNDFSDLPLSDPVGLLGQWHRTGYEEVDLVDYDTRNYKANAAIHLRTKPVLESESPELILSSNFGSGTTVYQGDNRFSLKGITFLQNRIEFRKRNKYFLRAYNTQTGAGESYDPYFTALKLQENSKDNQEWSIDYADYWQSEIVPLIQDSDYPKLEVSIDPDTGLPVTSFDSEGALQWQIDNNALLTQWHNQAAAYADGGPQNPNSLATPFFAPGTPEFEAEFNRITGTLRNEEGGTRFFDNSALYHVHGEYVFNPLWTDKITVGANGRMYTPKSKGTVFQDSIGNAITNSEVGVYAGIEKSSANDKVKLSGTVRLDKNQNFDLLVSPAASIVITPDDSNLFRFSFSSAIRNPTLTDQYLYLNVGPAILAGNLNGVENLVTVESVGDFFATQLASELDSFNIDAVRPEKVKTFEVGYRTSLFEKLFIDAGYYFSVYDDFLGFRIGVDLQYDNSAGPITIQRIQALRYAANSNNTVTTQGFSIGLNYFLNSNYRIFGNYSFNKLNKAFPDDPIIPAFNTPEHKFNIGFGGRNLGLIGNGKNLGFNVNYKWIEGFLFEGSPQFTGLVPTYDMLDAQVNYKFQKIKTTLKIGASNLLNNQSFQTYGGPRIGRLGYITLTYEPK